MADGTKIEWTDATWNIVTGCSVVSPGCTNCYAMKLAGTRLRHDPSRVGLTIDTKAGPVWNGDVRFNENWLIQPLKWKRPRRIFVCAHGDLFHESVPDEWLDQVFAVMALCPQHTFQVLTKRPDRMREYLSRAETPLQRIHMEAAAVPAAWQWIDKHAPRGTGITKYNLYLAVPWPLPNVWFGVSCEDQQRADERVPILLDTPAAVRWVSAEPLLGPIDFTEWLHDSDCDNAPCTCFAPREVHVDWIVTGGESGPHARPSNPQWFRDIRDQCAAAGVAFLHKQNGEFASVSEIEGPGAHFTFPDHRTVRRVGKKRAGRLLDGVTHDEYPSVA